MTGGRTLAYGLLGLPLAFAALPIYVHVPRFYAEVAGMELALLGAILLGTRLALRHGSGFVRVIFIAVVSVLILKTGFDAFLK